MNENMLVYHYLGFLISFKRIYNIVKVKVISLNDVNLVLYWLDENKTLTQKS